MSDRPKIPEKTKCILWAMSAGRCQKCGRLIYKHPKSDTISNFAQIAHCLPVGDKGPRCKYKVVDENNDINDISNLLLLCYDCHDEIDNAKENEYTPYVLTQIKSDFELAVVKATNFTFSKPTKAIVYSPNLHGRQQIITGMFNALFPSKYIDGNIELTLKNYQNYENITKADWDVEKNNLIKLFNKKVLPLIEENGDNLSIFAVGAIPLLVTLGSLLSNKGNIDVYQLRKTPSSWEWESDIEDVKYSTNVIHEMDSSEDIIVLLSLSGKVNTENALKSKDFKNYSAYEISIENQNDDFLRTQNHLNDFIKAFRLLKEIYGKKCCKGAKLHIFGAIPNSIAIEIGRQRNSNFELPYVTYEYKSGEYSEAIEIGGVDR